MSTQYPSDLPVSDLQNIITTIRGGTVVANKKAFAKSVWIVAGYGLGQTLGDNAAPAPSPTSPHILAASAAPVSSGCDLSDEDICDLLSPVAFPTGAGADITIAILSQLPWTEIVTWAVKTIPTLFKSGK